MSEATYLREGAASSPRTMNTFNPDRAVSPSPQTITTQLDRRQKLSEEVETIIYTHPGQYVREVVVAGVSAGTSRNRHEKLLRAWIVLSKAGEKAGDPAVVDALRRWTERNLVKSKWLHGGIEVVGEVRLVYDVSWTRIINHSGFSSRNRRMERHYDGFW